MALLTWQEVEKSHYKLFRRILGVQASPISSVVYFNSESFELRRRMVSRMASYFLIGRKYKKQRVEWQEIEKTLRDANDNRNKMAHYGAEYPLVNSTELPNGAIEFEFGEARLEPSPYNYVSKLLGRTPDKTEHSLSSVEINGYTKSFIEISGRLDSFAMSLTK